MTYLWSRIRTATFTAIVAAAAAGSASASIIYNNGGPTSHSGNEATQWLQAENFTLPTSGTITGAGVYIAGYGDINAWDGTTNYFVFADNAGAPGSQLAAGAGTGVGTADTGTAWCCGGNAYLLTFTFQVPFLANGGTPYWFGIHLAGDYLNRDDIYWVTASPNNGNGHESGGGTQTNWSNNGQEHAFYLTGNPVPEPGTLLLLGSGVSALVLRRRRKV